MRRSPECSAGLRRARFFVSGVPPEQQDLVCNCELIVYSSVLVRGGSVDIRQRINVIIANKLAIVCSVADK